MHLQVLFGAQGVQEGIPEVAESGAAWYAEGMLAQLLKYLHPKRQIANPRSVRVPAASWHVASASLFGAQGVQEEVFAVAESSGAWHCEGMFAQLLEHLHPNRQIADPSGDGSDSSTVACGICNPFWCPRRIGKDTGSHRFPIDPPTS